MGFCALALPASLHPDSCAAASLHVQFHYSEVPHYTSLSRTFSILEPWTCASLHCKGKLVNCGKRSLMITQGLLGRRAVHSPLLTFQNLELGVRLDAPGESSIGSGSLQLKLGRGVGGFKVKALEEGRGRAERPPISLVETCRHLQLCFFEVCVQNLGRSAGEALHGFVAAAVDAFMAGYTFDKVNLQIAYGSQGMEEFKMETAGYRLTASEEYYRTQWLTTIFVTLQLMRVADNDASRSAVTDDLHLVQLIHRTLEGQLHGEEQSLVKFDRGLATKGASGGVVAEKLVIAPQWVPVTQLVLLTMKGSCRYQGIPSNIAKESEPSKST